MKLLAGAILAMLLALGLSGCSQSSSTSTAYDTVTIPPLSSGKGAISGLVIDDRYRPVPDAMVLLSPVGFTVTSDAEGQFLFNDLDPGAYVATVQAPDHEAAPKAVDVEVGTYSEVEVQARRTFSGGSELITTQYSVFIACGVSAVVITVIANCLVDLSGNSYRTGFTADYTAHKKNATYLVVEFKATQKDGYFVPIGGCGKAYDGGTIKGDYAKFILDRGNRTPDHNKTEGYDAWGNDCKTLGATVFYVGSEQDTFKQYLGNEWGVGARLAVKATFLNSLFIGKPNVDLATYGPLKPPG